MAQQLIDNGAVTPDSLYSAADKMNANFTELYSLPAYATVFSTNNGTAGGNFGANATNYMAPYSAAINASDGNRAMVPKDGTLSHLYFKASADTHSASYTITVRVNGADSALAVTITAGVAFGTNASTTVSVVAGDQISFKLHSASGTGTSTQPNISVLYTA